MISNNTKTVYFKGLNSPFYFYRISLLFMFLNLFLYLWYTSMLKFVSQVYLGTPHILFLAIFMKNK